MPSDVAERNDKTEFQAEAGAKPAGDQRRTFLTFLVGIIATSAVFFLHFRPWQRGLLEDWGLALAWKQEGLHGYEARLPLTAGRPLLLLPHYFGMGLSQGGFVGLYLVFGLIAVAQLFVAIWALKPLVPGRFFRWALALALASHPWWAAGDLLRFMSAQVPVLGIVVWVGAALRYLAGQGRRWLVLAAVAPLLGLLTYEGPIVALLIGAFVLAGTSRADVRRRWVILVTTVGVACADLVWSMYIAPKLSPSSYEGQLQHGLPNLRAAVVAIARTMLHHAPGLLLFWIVVCLVVLELGFSRRLGHADAWFVFISIAAAPLAALSYVFTMGHLNDPERVALPIGVAVWLVACVAASALAATPRQVQASIALVLVASSLLGGAWGYRTWSSYAAAQEGLIAGLGPIRAGAPAGTSLVVADPSGRWGDVYLFLPPYLSIAMTEQDGPGADVVLCTDSGVARKQPVAAVYPIDTTVDCSTLLRPGAAQVGVVPTEFGNVQVFEQKTS